MLNSKKIEINGRSITVTEVSVRKVLQLMPQLLPSVKKDGEEETAETGFMANLEDLLQYACGLSFEELIELHPSELEKLWEAFREVNAFFFRMTSTLGLEERIGQIVATLLQNFGGLFAAFFAGAMQDASITASPGLTPPSETTNGNDETNG